MWSEPQNGILNLH